MKACEEITKHPRFQKVVSAVIILCSLVLGIETMLIDPEYKLALEIIDISITLFFIIEIFVRAFSYKSPLMFFNLWQRTFNPKTNKHSVSFIENGFWNWFDFIITLGSTVALLEHLFVHPEYFFVTRLFRIFRIFRLLEISEKMKILERKIATIVPTVFSFVLLIFVMLYIYAIVGFYLFNGTKMGVADFSNLADAILTMFQVMTLDGWGEILDSAENGAPHLDHWVFIVFFMSFIGITAIVTLNIFIAVLSSNVQLDNKKNDTLQNDKLIKYLIKEVKLARKEIAELKKNSEQ